MDKMKQKSPLHINRLFLRWGPTGDQQELDFTDFGGGINLVKGPNASGKTTTSRAIRKLLWKESNDPKLAYLDRTQLRLESQLKEDTWSLEWNYGRGESRRNGQTVDQPGWNTELPSDRYQLALHELLVADDHKLADKIYQEMLGGYDLDEARKQLGYSDTIRNKSIKEFKAFEEARRKEEEARAHLRELSKAENELLQLEENLKSYQSLEQRQDALQQLLRYRNQLNELRELESKLAQFDSIVGELTGNEYNRLQKLKEKQHDLRHHVDELQSKVQKLKEDQQALSIPEERLNYEVLSGWKRQLETLKNDHEKLDDQQQRITELQAELRHQQAAIRDLEWPEEWRNPQPGDWTQLESLIRKRLEVSAAREELEERIQATHQQLEQFEQLPPAGTIEQGLQLLRQLFRIPETDEESTPSAGIKPIWGWLALLILALSGAGAIWLSPWILLGGLLLSAGLLWWGMHDTESTDLDQQAHARQQAQLQQDFKNLRLLDPTGWDDNALTDYVNQLITLKERSEQQARLDERLSQLNVRRERLQEQAGQLSEQLDELKSAFGVLPSFDSDAALYQFVKQVAELNAIRGNLAGALNGEETLQKRVNAHRKELVNSLQSVNGEVINSTDLSSLQQIIARLDRDWNHWKDLENKRENLSLDLKHNQKQLREVDQQLEALRSVFPDQTDEAQMQVWCKQVPTYQRTKEQVSNQQAVVQNARNQAEEEPALQEVDWDANSAEIREELSDIERQLNQKQADQKRYNELSGEIHAARNRNDLEDAHGTVHDAWFDLKKVRDDNLDSVAGHELLNLLQECAQTDQAPAVMRRANEWFQKITNDRYQLKMSTREARSEFTALDTVNGQQYALEALSSGSRIQLLLAVRLAFVEEHETDVQFPLLVDELLANSDDTRAQQIIDALITIAKSGRQVFYFTAQSDEVSKWRRLADTHEVDITEHALNRSATGESIQIESEAVTSDGEATIPNLVTEVPDPTGKSHREYGEELGEPSSNLKTASVDQLHIWYFIEDPKILAELLKRNVDRWGPLKHLLERDPASLSETIDPEQLHADAGAIEEYLKLRQMGQPKPVDALVLSDSGAITETFWDAVVEKLEEVDHDPQALLQALENGEVSRFQSAKREELELYLEQQGYLPNRELLTAAERETRLKEYLALHPEADAAHVQRIIMRLENRQPAERTLFD
ncbi:MAG: AAA family ATPase [Bacteroidota bacterium]